MNLCKVTLLVNGGNFYKTPPKRIEIFPPFQKAKKKNNKANQQPKTSPKFPRKPQEERNILTQKNHDKPKTKSKKETKNPKKLPGTPKTMKNKGFHFQKTWFLGSKKKVFDGFGALGRHRSPLVFFSPGANRRATLEASPGHGAVLHRQSQRRRNGGEKPRETRKFFWGFLDFSRRL